MTAPRRMPTSDEVRGLWASLRSTYTSEVASKADSETMRLVAHALNAMGVLDAGDFLERFTTTIGRTIYVPFEVGVATERHTLWRQVVICVHEHVHIDQLDREGEVAFSLRYLLDPEARATYEAEAMRANVELRYWLDGQVHDLAKLAGNLRYYGCRSQDVDLARRLLEMSARIVRRGGVANRASQLAIDWLEQHTRGLRA